MRSLKRSIQKSKQQKLKQEEKRKEFEKNQAILQDEIEAIVTMAKLTHEEGFNFDYGKDHFTITEKTYDYTGGFLQQKGLHFYKIDRSAVMRVSSYFDQKTFVQLNSIEGISPRSHEIYFSDVYQAVENGTLMKVTDVILQSLEEDAQNAYDTLIKGSGFGFNLHTHSSVSAYDGLPDVDIDIDTKHKYISSRGVII